MCACYAMVSPFSDRRIFRDRSTRGECDRLCVDISGCGRLYGAVICEMVGSRTSGIGVAHYCAWPACHRHVGH